MILQQKRERHSIPFPNIVMIFYKLKQDALADFAAVVDGTHDLLG